jgi:ubiquinone/menaquinone biosynthesis C-methylase UbiE
VNAEKIDKKRILRDVFSRGAQGYAEIGYFQIFGRRLVEFADVDEGAHVLDIACGRGACLFPAIEKVGTKGNVIGIDLSEGMVRETGEEIKRRGLGNATLRVMDAESLDFVDGEFDRILCAFAMQFFPDLDKALNETYRVLRLGGSFAASTWSAYEDKSWSWFDELVEDYGAGLSLGSNALDEAGKITPWLERVGFEEIHTIPSRVDAVFLSEDDYWNMRWSVSGRAGLERLAPNRLAEFKNQVFEKMRDQKEPDGFHMQLEALFISGSKL